MREGSRRRRGLFLPRLRAGRWIRGILSVALCAALSACWDEVILQDVGYISALGIDFKDDKYVLYAQMINFTEIAKTDSPSKPQELWIGKGEGNSVLLAYSDLGRASYSTLNLEHLKTIVIHKRALSKIGDVLDGLNRHRASRYTAMFFGTTVPIEELFTTDNFFDQSPLNSVLYLPSSQERHNSFVKSLKMQSAVQLLKEPAMTTLLPVIGITSSYWKKVKKTMNTEIVKGSFVFKDFRFLGQLQYDEIIGLRWLNRDFKAAMIEASEEGNSATVSITNADYKLHALLEGEECRFRLKVKVTGHIIEMGSAMGKDRIVAIVERKIAEEIMSAYGLGVEKGLDLLNLEHHIYRYHNGYWGSNMLDRNWKPEEGMLKVETKLDLTNSGKLELKNNT
ncbi:Ger(x)C family spore germination protein [Paenibacillus sp. HB172176]|uniref:Ger(x)C family spore germination protein n=1 Tax=Paenibacillus sp. HB172176 TaxID=2493690 RepID=UPI00143AAF9D|nr:Ger(x)C family spore germination protein [Paenibacillus sp. HB172176]